MDQLGTIAVFLSETTRGIEKLGIGERETEFGNCKCACMTSHNYITIIKLGTYWLYISYGARAPVLHTYEYASTLPSKWRSQGAREAQIFVRGRSNGPLHNLCHSQPVI